MASGSRLTFLDPAALRSIYPGNFSTEFMFRSPGNLFSTVQFIPERVLEFSISPEGIRFYKVQWQETWLPEHHLIQYQNLIEIFWRNQSELASANCDNDQSSSSTPTSDVPKSVKEDVGESFLTTLQTDSVSLEPQISGETIQTNPVTSVIEKTIEEPQVAQSTEMGLTKQQEFMKQHDFIKQDLVKQDLLKHDILKQQEFLKQQEMTKQQEFVKSDFSKQQEFEIIVRRPDDQQIEGDVNNQITIEYNDVVLNLPNTQITMDVPLEGVNNIMHIPGDNELTKVISPRFKKNKATSLQLEGFELANIENPTATEEELRQQAREVLSSFRRKRVRFPNGSSKLPQTCFFCTKVLSNRKKLREHQFSIHFKNVGEFLCGICQQRFIFRRQLKAHMITHSDNRNYVCKLCGLTCKRRSHLHKHMDTHQKERNYRCDVCHKNFKVQAELKEHCLTEHKNQISKCNVCKQTLHTAYSVYIHSMRHSGTRDHICQVCGSSFKRKQHLIAHRKVHENATENIKCPACDKEFPEKKYFRRHLEQSHKELAPNYRYDYICTICDKDFAYKGRLDEHMKTHAEETEEERTVRARKKKVDTMTDDALSQLSDKIEKITNPKSGEVKLKCKLCRRREFRLISTMEKHLEDHKAGYKFMKAAGNFECTICKKSFYSEARLLRHNIVHQPAAVKPNAFQCRRCKKSFKWKSCLQAHTKKCAPISKGAGKRKATLKAKEKLRKQIEDVSEEEEIHIIHVDDIAGEEYSITNESEELKLASGGHAEEMLTTNIPTSTVHNVMKETVTSLSVQGLSPNGPTSTSENLITLNNVEEISNIISVTHDDGNDAIVKSNRDISAEAENIYVITVRPNNVMEVSSGLTATEDYSSEGYQLSGGLHNVEANVSVETVIHQGVSPQSVEIQTESANKLTGT